MMVCNGGDQWREGVEGISLKISRSSYFECNRADMRLRIKKLSLLGDE